MSNFLLLALYCFVTNEKIEMKKLIIASVLSLMSVNAFAALDNIKCMKYENSIQQEASRMVKTAMLSITQVPAQRWKIERMSTEDVNRSGYALFCDKDFKNENIVQYTFGVLLP